MIVFDLKCSKSGHVFEGWFSSGDDFDRQRDLGLVACPICGDLSVGKAVMAPAVAPKGNQRPSQPVVSSDSAKHAVPMSAGVDAEKALRMMQVLAQAQAEALSGSEWVGRRFAEAARAMHYGEQDSRPIHGEVPLSEARSLIEEGVEVAPLLFPVAPPDAQN